MLSKLSKSVWLPIWITAAGFLAVHATQSLAQQIDKKPIPETSAVDGPEMYKAYCASCHGERGKGDGPAVSALKMVPPDLSQMAKNHGGAFPAMAVMVLLGSGGGAHGSADMPIWGDIFRDSRQPPAVIRLRLYNLTRHLELMQDPAGVAEKVASAAPAPQRPTRIKDISPVFGGEMYYAYCASCHGADARGTGPAAASLKTPPADLTKLKEGDGKFPFMKVQHLLLDASVMTSHGSSAMPIWGDVFRATGEDSAIIRMRANNLIRYLESIQR